MNAPQPVLLLTPGPTPLHPRAAAALSWPMIGHMDPEVFAFNDRVARDLKTLYGADEGAFTALLSGTGSLGMEAGFANLMEKGDKALILSNGVFGERMAEMAARLGAAVTVLQAPLGQPFEVAEVRRVARELRPKLLSVVHGETSTGVLNPVPEIGEVAREIGALYSVDAVTTVGMLPFNASAWGVDYAYTGSQKCLSAPPGLAPVMFSRRAMTAITERKTPVSTWYGDAVGMQGYWGEGALRSYHHTVPVQLHWATGEAIRATLEEGIPARAARARALEDAALYALSAVGFSAFVPAAYRLPTVLAVALPEGFDDAGMRAALRERYRISVTGGLGATAGKIWRLGLMGESAHAEHYGRLMDALAELLGAPQLKARFEEATAGAAVVR
jgi:alanine-glyoxylate transaminase/serine-glyoxylate transaminase/serine-pyruvate transaminase